MIFSYNSAVRECKRMGKGYTIQKMWYGWIVVDSRIDLIKANPSTTRLWPGGYRVDIPQDDEKFYTELKMAEEIVTDSRSKEENDPKWGIVRTGYNQGLTINEIPTDFKMPKAPPIPPGRPKEVDKAKKVVDAESGLSEKDKVFRDALLILLGQIEIKTLKIDQLLNKLRRL